MRGSIQKGYIRIADILKLYDILLGEDTIQNFNFKIKTKKIVFV